MNLKKKPAHLLFLLFPGKTFDFKLKKIPYYLAILALAGCASIVIGLLSFGGMLALSPLVWLAVGSALLAVVYEGEIYLKNIQDTWNKLFKSKYIERSLARKFLFKHFPDVNEKGCPQFFKDYKAQWELVNQFGHHPVEGEALRLKKQAEKTLKDMEKWFADELFSTEEADSEYKQELKTWFQAEARNKVVQKLQTHYMLYRVAAVLSIITVPLMGWFTSNLVMGEVANIAFLAAISPAALPFIIISVSAVAGLAYGFLVYNAFTSMVEDNTLKKLYKNVTGMFDKGLTLRSFALGAATVVLLGLAVALTFCTAGTWWTVAKNAPPIFSWMRKLPDVVIAMLAAVAGLASLIFIVQNTAETLNGLAPQKKGGDEKEKSVLDEILGFFNEIIASFRKIGQRIQKTWNKENFFQFINPFRLILIAVLVPLKILLFFCHLVSIAVTTDRLPGLSELKSAIIGFISELGEDWHYFFPHKHHHAHTFEEMLKEGAASAHGHNHDDDLPTKIVNLLFAPIYLLAALWAWGFSQFNKQKSQLGFFTAWQQQTGQKEPKEFSKEKLENLHQKAHDCTSVDWKIEQGVYCVENYKQKHFGSNPFWKPELAKQKKEELSTIQTNLRSLKNKDNENVHQIISNETSASVFKENRNTLFPRETPDTAVFINHLSERIGVAPAMGG